MRYTLTLIIFCCLAATIACTNSSRKGKPGNKGPAVTEPSPTPGDEKPQPKDDRPKKDECKEGGISLNLLADINYEDDLKSVIDRACLGGCHVPGGQSAKDLSTYDEARSYAELMADSVSAGRMPIGGRNLSAAEQALFSEWVDAGKPKSASDDNGSSDDDDDQEEDTDSNSDDDRNDTDSNDDPFFGNCKDKVGDREDFDRGDLLDLDAKRACNEDGEMYDYDLKRCTEELGDYDCDKEGIVAAFKAARIDPKAIDRIIDEYESDGFEIDQCGFDGKAPLILFLKDYSEVTDTDQGVAQLYLCRKGSSYCENN